MRLVDVWMASNNQPQTQPQRLLLAVLTQGEVLQVTNAGAIRLALFPGSLRREPRDKAIRRSENEAK